MDFDDQNQQQCWASKYEVPLSIVNFFNGSIKLVQGDWIVTLVLIVSMQIKDPGVDRLSQMANRTDNYDESGAQARMSGGWPYHHA